MRQEHRIDFGEGGEAILIIDDPLFKFLKKASVVYDLSKCKEGYRELALKYLSEIVLKKLEKRPVTISIIFPTPK